MIEVGDPVVITKICCTPQYLNTIGTVRKMFAAPRSDPFGYWYCDVCGHKFPLSTVMCLLTTDDRDLWPLEWLKKLFPPKLEIQQQEETHA